ncbi:MAG: hypothetical protein AAF039_15115 [Bacteroidota bacterium]
MSLPYEYNIPKNRAGDSYSPFDITDLQADGVDMDLSNVTIVMHIKEGGSQRAELTIGNGITLLTANSIRVEIPKIPRVYGKLYWDIQFTFPGDIVKTLFKGTLEQEKDVTQ